MYLRYTLFKIAAFTINFLCWYYVIIFCNVYSLSSPDWAIGALIGLALDWGCFALLIPLLKTALRLTARKNPKMKILYLLEYCFWVTNFFA